jgi:hypothetical protein
MRRGRLICLRVDWPDPGLRFSATTPITGIAAPEALRAAKTAIS